MINELERFRFKNRVTEMTMLDFWKWHYSDIYDLQDKIAEFIVAKTLGKENADNTGSWTLYDILYRGYRIEVKETSYYHSWQTDDEPKSRVRNFSIAKAYSNYQDNTSSYERQNDIYVFCLNSGDTKEESNPIILDHWEFYVVPTSLINEKCGDSKTISLSRVRSFVNKVDYSGLKRKIDLVIDSFEEHKTI